MFNQKSNTTDQFAGLDVKIVFAGTKGGVKRIKTPLTYVDLVSQVDTLSASRGIKAGMIKYKDADGDLVVIEDENDLEMAYTIALSSDKKITFTVMKPDNVDMISAETITTQATAQLKEPSLQEEEKDVDMEADNDEFTIPVKKRKGKKDKGEKGIPRKALKNLIAHELETSAKASFEALMKQKDLNMGEEAGEEGMMIDTNEPKMTDVRADETVEHLAACDGCDVYPIKGIRYKCSVRKDYDLCSTCEERMSHPHPFLKIRNPSEVPTVMVTVLNEEAPKQQPAPQQAQRPHHGHGHHGRHGHGHHGGHGQGHHGGPRKWMQILHQFMKKKNITAEEIQAISVNAGVEMPLEIIKGKMDFFEKMANGEEFKWDANMCKPGGNGHGPFAWFKIVAQVMKEKNITPEEIAEMSKEGGHEMSAEEIKTKMDKFKAWQENPSAGFGGYGGCHGNGKGEFFKGMMKNFMQGDTKNIEEFAKNAGFKMPEGCMEKMKQGMEGWKKNCGEWKNKRAIMVSKNHENAMTILPGQTSFAEIEMKNGTQWPWKQGCFLGMDDTKEGDDQESAMPIEPVNMPVPFAVAGNQTFKLTVPLKVHDQFPSSAKEYVINMSFRGPHGNTFGERITFKVIVGAPEQQIDEMQLFTLALKLHQELNLGSFDDCVSAARLHGLNEAATVAYLQAKPVEENLYD